MPVEAVDAFFEQGPAQPLRAELGYRTEAVTLISHRHDRRERDRQRVDRARAPVLARPARVARRRRGAHRSGLQASRKLRNRAPSLC